MLYIIISSLFIYFCFFFSYRDSTVASEPKEANTITTESADRTLESKATAALDCV